MNQDETFGGFIREKRKEKDYTLRGFAAKMDLSPVHMSNLENDRRAAPKDEVLERMAKLLTLSNEERNKLYDLAAKSKNAPTVALDLPEYINENQLARIALRTAKDVDATDEEWLEFIAKLQARVRKEDEAE
ncbi:MAG: helix-turn-helix transcriptional regulator [Clostridiales bacterium]|jgi:transcriptional regulator with XRE-family HTH domain|nr:helix-turn-helix transcriptional regulator [Clostridiales bacterium]